MEHVGGTRGVGEARDETRDDEKDYSGKLEKLFDIVREGVVRVCGRRRIRGLGRGGRMSETETTGNIYNDGLDV